MGSIIPAGTAIDTFRDSGYKNTASAISELIDNSIEAGAKDIQILTYERQVAVKQRMVYQIQDVAIYDDGIGMPEDVLSICLQFGNGTRLKSRSGIGRFGIGLPNASVSQARRVEVYSWRNGKCLHTYLDVDEIKEHDLSDVNGVTEVNMPEEYLANVEGKIAESGTLIVWRKCDRLDMARSSTLFTTMSKDLCRIYRHFLDDDDDYGERVRLLLVTSGKERKVLELHANDPLYLMIPNNVPGYSNKATNVLHGNIITIPAEYDSEGHTADVEIRMSVALPETQALGGGSPLGTHYMHNTGISFVRAAREIDFGTFSFFNPREERQRWWGCEIRFEPILDELFGVTNNKQSVRGVNYLDVKEFLKEHIVDGEEILQEDLKLKLRTSLSKAFYNNHKQLMDVIKNRHAGKKGKNSKEKASSDKSTVIANEALKESKDNTKSIIEAKNKSIGEITVEWAERLEKGDVTLSHDDAIEVAKQKANLKVEKDFSNWPGSQFFSIETTGQTCVVVINRRHPFFTELYEPLLNAGDSKYIDAMDLLIMSYARVEDEMYSHSDELEDIREKWGSHLKAFLSNLKVHT